MGVVLEMQGFNQAQTQSESIEVIKTDNAIVYVRKENGITIIEAFSKQRQKPYEVWCLHRDEKIKRLLHQYHEALDRYHDLRLHTKGFKETIRRLKRLKERMEKQDKDLHMWFVERLENEIEMLNEFYGKLKADKEKEKALIKTMRRKFEVMRKLAIKQFEEYKPMHSLPISDWKKRIELLVSSLRAYENNFDFKGLMIMKRLATTPPWKNKDYTKIKVTEIEKYRDLYRYTQWIEILNELAIEVFEDKLNECIDSNGKWNANECGKFKKPSIVKLLQSYMDNIDWNGVTKSIEIWLRAKH